MTKYAIKPTKKTAAWLLGLPPPCTKKQHTETDQIDHDLGNPDQIGHHLYHPDQIDYDLDHLM